MWLWFECARLVVGLAVTRLLGWVGVVVACCFFTQPFSQSLLSTHKHKHKHALYLSLPFRLEDRFVNVAVVALHLCYYYCLCAGLLSFGLSLSCCCLSLAGLLSYTHNELVWSRSSYTSSLFITIFQNELTVKRNKETSNFSTTLGTEETHRVSRVEKERKVGRKKKKTARESGVWVHTR